MRTITLHGAKAAGRVALVDDEDYELVNQYHWNVWEWHGKGPYASTHTPRPQRYTLSMHRLVTGFVWAKVDHRNHNGLDNQRYNLRDGAGAKNNQNTQQRLGGSSQYKGVSWKTEISKWVVQISPPDYKQIFLGYFTDEVEAAMAYDAAAKELFGEYAYINIKEK